MPQNVNKTNPCNGRWTRLLRTRGSRDGSPWLREVASWDLGDFCNSPAKDKHKTQTISGVFCILDAFKLLKVISDVFKKLSSNGERWYRAHAKIMPRAFNSVFWTGSACEYTDAKYQTIKHNGYLILWDCQPIINKQRFITRYIKFLLQW